MDKRDAFFESLLNRRVSRRGFLKLCLAVLALFPLLGHLPKSGGASQGRFNGRVKKGVKGDYDIVVSKGEDPYRMTVKAIGAMGGMGTFVRKGDIVVVKPNMAWDRAPEQAANTNPQVVAALVELALGAGAKKVEVFDISCNDQRRSYESSGIAKAAREKGAEVFFPEEWDTLEARFDYDSPMEGWPILRDAVECDTFIDVPILKHHGLTGLTISMKNLMGVCAGRRGLIHQGIGRKIVDLADFISPDLIVIDAYRALLRNGPTGGDLGDVENLKTLIVATDPTLADIYASTLAGWDPESIPNIRVAIERGFGSSDIKGARIMKVEA